MIGIGLVRSLQRGSMQSRGVAFQAALIAASSKKVHMTLSKSTPGMILLQNSMEFSLDGESIAYQSPLLQATGENYDDYAILESVRAKDFNDSLMNVISIKLNRSEQQGGL